MFCVITSSQSLQVQLQYQGPKALSGCRHQSLPTASLHLQVRLELRYQGHIDLNVNMMAHVLNDSQYAKPGAWQPHVGPGQADLEGHLINRRLRVSHTNCLSAFMCVVIISK